MSTYAEALTAAFYGRSSQPSLIDHLHAQTGIWFDPAQITRAMGYLAQVRALTDAAFYTMLAQPDMPEADRQGMMMARAILNLIPTFLPFSTTVRDDPAHAARPTSIECGRSSPLFIPVQVDYEHIPSSPGSFTGIVYAHAPSPTSIDFDPNFYESMFEDSNEDNERLVDVTSPTKIRMDELEECFTEIESEEVDE